MSGSAYFNMGRHYICQDVALCKIMTNIMPTHVKISIEHPRIISKTIAHLALHNDHSRTHNVDNARAYILLELFKFENNCEM